MNDDEMETLGRTDYHIAATYVDMQEQPSVEYVTLHGKEAGQYLEKMVADTRPGEILIFVINVANPPR